MGTAALPCLTGGLFFFQFQNALQKDGGKLSFEANFDVMNCDIMWNQQGVQFKRVSKNSAATLGVQASAFFFAIALFFLVHI